MASFDDTFDPAALTRSDTLASTVSTAAATKAPPGSATKAGKAPPSSPRIDLEPLYTELKGLISHHWDTYHDALTRFLRGELNSREFGDLCDVFIYASPQTEHAHNSLLLAVLHNATRDPPEPGLAPWVSAASDKTTLGAASKPAAAGDVGEQRLKAEVMALPARDRRRLKGVATDKAEEEAAARKNAYEDYYAAGRIRAPETAGTGGGGIAQTNWNLEIRKKYMQPLFAESLEFPDAAAIHSRIVPICFEEGIAGGCSTQCAELVAVSAETMLKGVLTEILNRTRANGPRYNSSPLEGIMTSNYRRRLTRQEADVARGKLARTREDDLLPVEAEAAYARRPLGMADLQLAARVGPSPWNATPLIGMTIANASTGADYEDWQAAHAPVEINGHAAPADLAVDKMDVDGADDEDDDNYGWEGASARDQKALQALLADCLAAPV